MGPGHQRGKAQHSKAQRQNREGWGRAGEEQHPRHRRARGGSQREWEAEAGRGTQSRQREWGAGVLVTQGRDGEQGMIGSLAALGVVLLACPDIHARAMHVPWGSAGCHSGCHRGRGGHEEGGHPRRHPPGLPCSKLSLG